VRRIGQGAQFAAIFWRPVRRTGPPPQLPADRHRNDSGRTSTPLEVEPLPPLLEAAREALGVVLLPPRLACTHLHVPPIIVG